MTDLQTPEDPLAKVIEKSIEKHTHMARRLYPDVYASHVAADVREWLAAEHGSWEVVPDDRA